MPTIAVVGTKVRGSLTLVLPVVVRTWVPQRSPRLSYVLSPLMSQGRQSDDDLGLVASLSVTSSPEPT